METVPTPLLSTEFEQSQSSFRSSDSELSNLSENNDVPVHDLNGLQKWLAKGKKQLAKLFASHGSTSSSGSKQRGPYKRKGTLQSVRTQQHNKKTEHDWAAKMKMEGYGDLQNFFNQKAPSPQGSSDVEEIENANGCGDSDSLEFSSR